jgi:hypothetical protein
MTEDSACIWPKCPKPLGDHPATKLCNSHAFIVWQQVDSGYQADRERERILANDLAEQQRTRFAQRKPTNTAGTIYYLRVGENIKIGWAGDLAYRMRQYPPNSELLASHPGTRDDERELHRRLSECRTHGREWYSPTVILMRHIEGVIAEHGTPPTVRFVAKPSVA